MDSFCFFRPDLLNCGGRAAGWKEGIGNGEHGSLEVVNAVALHSTPCLPTAKGSHRGEAELVSCVKAGDKVAFRELIERHEARIFGVICGILGNRDDAEDVAQQVFAKVYFSISTLDGRSSLYTWIYRIAVHECYGFLRKQWLKLVNEGNVADDALAGSMLDAAGMHPLSDRAAKRNFVNKLLARVSEDDRLLLLGKEIEGLSLEELVELTGLNKNTIRERLYRTRRRLMQAARWLQSPKGTI
jgi:RNA polymerase sigma-70 factor, ECF subfamily